MSVPVFDVSRAHAGAVQRAALARELTDAAHSVGFFQITGYDASPAQALEMLSLSREFFALPESDRMALNNLQSRHFRGYTRLGHERTRGQADAREQLDIGPERDPVEPGDGIAAYWRLQGPNQWPASLPALREAVLEWQRVCSLTALTLLQLLAEGMGLATDTFDTDFTGEASSHLKIVRYQRLSADADQGVGAHKDYGYLALLLQDGSGGLQARPPGSRDWLDIEPVAGALVVNLGEMLEVATDGYLIATEHRVLAPPAGRDRISIPYFPSPRLDTRITPLPLAPELRAQARGVTRDADNPLHTTYGENALKGWLRAHPRGDRTTPFRPSFNHPERTHPPMTEPQANEQPGASEAGLPPENPTPDTTAWSFETKQIHAGAVPDPTTGARATPIYQTTSYVFRDTEHAANLFGLAEAGNIYTRIMNPTQTVLEDRVTALEGGIAAVATASGQSAETLALLTLASAGDHIVASSSLYGGTYNLLHYTLPKLGITTTFIDDPDDLDAWRAAVQPTTRAFYGETLGNPRANVLDIRGIADVAHEAGVPLVVDNTVPSPYLLRPIEHGADIVVHSATKFLGGHGTSVAGVVVDGGTFDFGANAAQHPGFNEPDPSYHGLVYWEALGQGAFAAKLRVQYLRDIGPAISPFNAFQILQGIETLSLRMDRHSASALSLATWLESRDEVETVYYAGLPSSPYHEAAKKYLPRGAGAVVAFELAGGIEAGKKFVDALELFSHLANIGDVRSLVIHPASTTHSQLTPEEQLTAGVTPGLVRLSVGLEGLEDLKADLSAGFRAAKGA